MKYLLLEGFPKGLDARKFNLSAPAGTLVELQDGHLTNGGEIEKRKAFVEYADVTQTETGAEATTGVRTFGMQETSVGLTVFGSAFPYGTALTYATTARERTDDVATLTIGAHNLAVGSWVRVATVGDSTYNVDAIITAVTATTISYANDAANEASTADVAGVVSRLGLSQPVLSAAMPTGVAYQQLQHPAVRDGVTYEKTKHAIVSTGAIAGGVYSRTYGSAIFALATFYDGNTFGYYDGALVRDFTDGLVMAHIDTNVKLAQALTELINRSEDFTATQLANPNDHKVNVTGPTGEVYSLSAAETSDDGTLTVTKTSDPTGTVPARAAVGGFTVVAGSAGAANKITKVEVNGVEITDTTGDVAWTTSNEVTAKLLADSINTHNSSPEYSATASGAVVTITAATSVGDTPNDYVVKVTCEGDVCIGRAQFQVIATSGFTSAVAFVDGENITGTVNYTTSPSATATAIAAAINAGTTAGAAHGYLANATGAIVSISKAVTLSTDEPLPVVWVVTGGNSLNDIIEVGTGIGAESGMELSIFGYEPSIADAQTKSAYVIVQLIITGGVEPYQTPQWFNYDTLGALGGPIDSSGRQCLVRCYHNGGLTAPWFMPGTYATVKDATGMTVKSNALNYSFTR